MVRIIPLLALLSSMALAQSYTPPKLELKHGDFSTPQVKGERWNPDTPYKIDSRPSVDRGISSEDFAEDESIELIPLRRQGRTPSSERRREKAPKLWKYTR